MYYVPTAGDAQFVLQERFLIRQLGFSCLDANFSPFIRGIVLTINTLEVRFRGVAKTGQIPHHLRTEVRC